MKPYDRITLDHVATFPRPGATVPVRIGFSPDGQTVTYLFSAEHTAALALWSFGPATGQHQLLLGPAEQTAYSLAEQLRRERERLAWEGVTSYQFAKDARPFVLLAPQGGSLRVRVGEGPWREVPGSQGASDPELFPDGSRVAFVKQGELHVTDLATGHTRQLTEGAAPGLTHGLAEYVAQEELNRHRGYWLSPDAAQIAFTEVDERHIPPFPIVHQEHDPVTVEEHRYPFVGQANAHVRLGVLPVAGGKPRWLLEVDDNYLARVAWTPASRLAVLLLDRNQRHMEWRLYDPKDGTHEVLLTETADHWLNLSDDTRFLTSGEVLFSSERSGFRHLYLRSADGASIRQLTEGAWMVTGLLDLDPERRIAYFAATAASPLERQIYAVSLDGGEPRRLTTEPGWHTAVFAPDHQRFVDQVSSLQHAANTYLCHVDGRRLAVLHEQPEATAQALGLNPPEIVTLEGDDGTLLYGAVYAPRRAAAAQAEVPAIVNVYGGPHAQLVTDTWDLTSDLRAQYLAQQGFLVFRLDNRGSANRGVAFERAIHRRFGTVELDDQLAGVRWLVRERGVDPKRVGIYGWSYGGYMTLMALAKAPEVFKVGVAGAPVTDFRWYDTAYTERYMETPTTNQAGYDQAAVMTHLAGLRGKLCVIHGMVDENVHFRHTAQLIGALVEAQKPFDLLPIPGARHMTRGFATLRLVAERTAAWFEAHL